MGGILAGFIMQGFGRRLTSIVSALPYIIGLLVSDQHEKHQSQPQAQMWKPFFLEMELKRPATTQRHFFASQIFVNHCFGDRFTSR